ncbi:MAG: DUF2062 domain-containing protein [Mariprofundus sp.]|nr:DUF2062 domain-containing protein [Mariprofundus sp.]
MTPRRLVQRFLPDHRTIRDHKALKCFGKLLHDPALWHLNRHSVAKAYFVGLVCAFIPIPFQMVLAAAVAIMIRSNLPISVALVWLTNPLTMPPLFYMAYKVGAWMMGLPEQDFLFEPSLDWVTQSMSTVWEPFLLGCAVLGVGSGALGYVGIQLLWRWMVVRRWRGRGHRDLDSRQP